MSTVNINLSSDTQLNMILGQQDETEVREVVFDFSGWYTTYGSGTISLSVQRHKDEWPYEVDLTVDGTNHTATWTITDTDTGYAGVGMVQITYTVGTAKKKSVVYRFTVYKSLGANGNVITPVQIQDFIDEVEDALEDIEADIADINQDLAELQNDAGVTADLKQALLQLASKVAYIDDDGQDYYDDLYDALYPNAQSITCVYTQTGTVYNTDSLDSLKDDLVVTAHYSDSTTKVLKNSDYTLSGTLTAGTSTVSVHYGDLTTTFTVTVTARTLLSISAVYTQSGYVYTDDSLDGLKTDLVVTATYSDSSSDVLQSSDYTLSGTLSSGTSAITVTYEDKTATFNVTVTDILYAFENGTYTFTTYGHTIKVEDGNTVTFTLAAINKDGHVNISELSNNTATGNSTDNYKNGGQTYFTIPAGSILSATAEVLAFGDYNSSTKGTVPFRLNASTPSAVLSVIPQDTLFSSLSVGQTFTNSYTAESDTEISCCSMYIGNHGSLPSYLKVKITAYLDGVRII